MSLPALALLITATCALRETAQAHGALDGEAAWLRVEMEPHEPLASMDGSSTVLCATFIGDETHAVQARRWYDGDRKIELAVQILLPPLSSPAFGGQATRIDAHKAGARVAFAAAHRLLELALGSAPGRPEPAGGSWGELYRRLVTVHATELNGLPFLASTKAGVEVPGLDYSIALHTIASPLPGDPEVYGAGFWADLVAKMRTDPRVADTADFMAALIKGDVLAPWQLERTLAGLSGLEAEALGLGPMAGLDEEPATASLTLVGDLGSIRVAADTPEPL